MGGLYFWEVIELSTTVSAFISDLASKVTHAYANADILSFINDVESNVYADNVKLYAVQYYRRQNNLYQYSLPSGVNFEDIYKMYVNGTEYKRVDVRTHQRSKSYYYENSKINFYPVPTDTDAQYVSGANQITFKAISYTSGASEITFASGTITTTGTAFTASAFVVGNKITITGCLTTENNKEAVITGVAASVLTFASGTFDADTTPDTGTINLATNCIYTSGVDFDGFAVDDVALVSGCLLNTNNNKYGVITDVQDDVLTFALGTFTAQAEVAAITIQAPKIKMIYQVKPTTKLIADIATDTLLIPDRFKNIYTYYCLAQMAYFDKEYKDYQVHMTMYNNRVQEYENWYGGVKPQRPENEIVASEDIDDTYGSVDFDTEE